MKNILLGLSLVVSSIVSSQTNYALSLNGTNEYASVGSLLPNNSSYTKEAWVYLTSGVGPRNILSSANTPFWVEDGILRGGQAGDYNYVYDPVPMTLNTWVYVALTYDGSAATMKLYRNGNLVSTKTAVPAYVAEPAFIGSHFGTASYWQGAIDEVRFWNKALTIAELKKNMLRGPAANSVGLMGYYRFNEPSGNTLVNSSTYSPGNSTITGTGTRMASPVQFGANALSLDGVNDYVDLGGSAGLKIATNLTVELWVKSANWAVAAQQQIVSSFESGGYGLTLTPNGNLNFFIRASTGTSYVGNSYPVSNLTNNTWYHIAGTFDGRYTRLYVNGNLVSTYDLGSSGNTITYTTAVNLFVGADPTNGADVQGMHLNAQVDELRIWNTVRTQTELQAKMDAELDPNNSAETNNLAAYYTFNQGAAASTNTNLTIVADEKGTFTGTLKNFSLSGTTSNYVQQKTGLVVLPVRWLAFTAQEKQGKVELNWLTSVEKNTLSFTVQHSSNGSEWQNIGILPAATTLAEEQAYHFVHDAPVKGTNTYRILQKDRDGKSSYSVIRQVTVRSLQTCVQVRNTLVTNTIEVNVCQPSHLTLYTSAGELVKQYNLKGGNHALEVSGLTKGIYYLSAEGATQKIIIQ
jgi:hypothetical protein